LNVWRREDLSARLLDYVGSHSSQLVWWDQDALNAVLHGRWLPSPAKWNATNGFFHRHPASVLGVSKLECQQARRDPCIVHFTGSYKPWMPGEQHPFKYEYYKYLRLAGWRNLHANGNRLVDQVRNWVKLWIWRQWEGAFASQ
jgi:lipopolysaccharide biosynthesis glycosyltransferase